MAGLCTTTPTKGKSISFNIERKGGGRVHDRLYAYVFRVSVFFRFALSTKKAAQHARRQTHTPQVKLVPADQQAILRVIGCASAASTAPLHSAKKNKWGDLLGTHQFSPLFAGNSSLPSPSLERAGALHPAPRRHQRINHERGAEIRPRARPLSHDTAHHRRRDPAQSGRT